MHAYISYRDDDFICVKIQEERMLAHYVSNVAVGLQPSFRENLRHKMSLSEGFLHFLKSNKGHKHFSGETHKKNIIREISLKTQSFSNNKFSE